MSGHAVAVARERARGGDCAQGVGRRAHVGRRPPSAHPSCAAARLSGRVPQEKKGGAEETKGHRRPSRAAGDGEGVARQTRILLRWGGAALREGSKRTTTSTTTHFAPDFLPRRCGRCGLIEKLSRMGASARPRVRL